MSIVLVAGGSIQTAANRAVCVLQRLGSKQSGILHSVWAAWRD